LGSPFFSAFFQSTTLTSDPFPQNNRALSPFLSPRELLFRGLFGSDFMPCRCYRLTALITRPCFAPIDFSWLALCCPQLSLANEDFTVENMFPLPSSCFLLSCVHLNTCVRIYVRIHYSLLQGDILLSRGPHQTRPAPLVSQVVLSPCVIDWGEGLGVLGLPTTFSHVAPCGCVLHITTQDQDKTKESPPLPSSTVFSLRAFTLSACLRIDVRIIFVTRFCREIF
jgi:hypothetical protein